MTIDWTRHATKSSRKPLTRKLSLPVSEDLQKAINFFKAQNDEYEFTDTSVLMTFIEAGVRMYVTDLNKARAQVTTQNTTQNTTQTLTVLDDTDNQED